MYLVRQIFLFALMAAGPAAGPAVGQDESPVVAAASNLQFAVTEVAESFTATTGMKVRLSFGSTGNISRQIREGAPFEMFLAADDSTPLALDSDGFALDGGAVYALGRIAVVAPTGSPLDVEQGIEGVRALLEDGTLSRFAIANPEHAPYGIAAREALISAGLWDQIEPMIVFGENVSQAAKFAMSGNAEGGIIAYSLALAPEVAPRGSHVLIPEDKHEPLQQRMILLNGSGPVAEEFYDYMSEPAARAIMSRHGFVLPESE